MKPHMIVSKVVIVATVLVAFGVAATSTQPQSAAMAAGAASATPSQQATSTLTADEQAAGGPIVGDQQAFPTEAACMKSYAATPSNNLQGFYPAIGAAEHTDSVRSGLNACASWTGVYNVTGNYQTTNQVYAYAPQDKYLLTNFINFTGPNQGFLGGGAMVSGTDSSGIYVASFNPASGQQKWRTYLNNWRMQNSWNAFQAQSVLTDGTLLVAEGVTVYRIDPNNGSIMSQQNLPTLGSPAAANNLDGMVPAPDGMGTIIAKTQTRGVPCSLQGNTAATSCGPQPNSTVVAFNGSTLQVYDAVELPQFVNGRNIVVTYKGQIYTYIGGSSSIFRLAWNPQTKKLTLDTSWNPTYTQPGQGGGTATAILNDWIIQNTNSAPSNTPQCIVSVNQANASNLHRICPFGNIPSGFQSETLASPGVDAANSMFYAQDMGIGGVYGIKLDQSTGNMTVVWSRPDWRVSDYFSLVGPANQRVLLSQNLMNITSLQQIFSGNYQETVLWVNAATGATLAQSSLHSSTAIGSLVNVGSGGRITTMGNAGTNIIYQVGPYQTPVPSPTPKP